MNDHDPVDRLLDGTATPDERQRLAIALRADPQLRQRLRQAAIAQARLVRATRAPRHRPSWLPWTAAASLAAALIAGLLWISATTPAMQVTDGTLIAGDRSTTQVAAGQAFQASDNATVAIGSHAAIRIEGGSRGIAPRSDAGLQLDQGGIQLSSADDSPALPVRTSAGVVQASGDVSVRYLDVPDDDLPAVHVEVTRGYALLVQDDQHIELRAGDDRILAPGRRIRGRMGDSDADQRSRMVHATGTRQVSWRIDHDHPLHDGAPAQAGRVGDLARGTEVVVHVARDGRQVSRIEVDRGPVWGVLTAWDPQARKIRVILRKESDPRTFAVANQVAVAPALLGKTIRIDQDPAPPYEVVRITTGRKNGGAAE